jgi:arginyl-tRNA synthetase
MIRKDLLELLNKSVNKLGVVDTEINLTRPSNILFGDFTTNIALRLSKQLNKNPIDLANEIAKNISENKIIKKINVVKPGFINFFIKKSVLFKEINKILKNNEELKKEVKKQKIILEYGQPNTHKVPHIGHLYSYIYGESLARLLEFLGHDVKRLNYQGDIGLNVAKCLYIVNKNMSEIKKLKSLKQKIDFLQKSYQQGSKLYEKDKTAEKEIDQLNILIYKKDRSIYDLWKETRQWSLDFYKEFEKTLGVKYDKNYFESESSEQGKKIVEENIGLIFEKSQGAVIFRGEKYNLHTRIFINSFGNPTYEGKEIGLNYKKMNDFDFDTSIVTTASEQNEYYKVTTKATELLFPKLKDKLKHLGYGMINLETGKISSRTGKIIDPINLIETIKNQIRKEFKSNNITSEKLSLASIKYSFLTSDPFKNIIFNIEKSIAKEGHSAAYILYTYVRTRGILKKISLKNRDFDIEELNNEEDKVLRLCYCFSEVIKESMIYYKPNILANYLYELSKIFNIFYQKHQVVNTDNKNRNKRTYLTETVSSTLKLGLYLLGIGTVEKM